jgi:hypothetical protein
MTAAREALLKLAGYLCPFALAAALLGAAPGARADTISFQLSDTTLSVTSPGSVTFFGTVTNQSGVDLNASDFFFNFSGFDPAAVTPSQDLGVATDFPILTAPTSALTDLCSVTVSAVSPGARFPLEVQMQDINNDLSATETVNVVVPVPLPDTALLLACGLIAFWVARRQPLFRGEP